ncbi:cysteine desulfurase associated protein [Ligilactobacillus saerimneri]|uniref:Cysteine desulfurase associated protein n=2 Tax=Ligilactobacillus saerimneri TaxID=228229 RepID=M5J4W9_9LACO|nr:cysteine desulfurase associated protein [Ligilactobacillus saerimneri]EKW99568.1 cysteine desulfurase associated protein [Ligilactobacillus saerimneri 30a]KRL74374.1 hypothetical protein FC54_GL001495 [Ligilactobacillus saerimneri DSM 16049]MBU5309329.1 DUF1831 domain-containing protein [Ligilactobacillus saerimneri]MCZ0891900.1 cysteine desulfurase [Ligilactobacillus saerimneri]MDI9205951.1 cysteine desulfurase [Ligilactobacillus saerimneri]
MAYTTEAQIKGDSQVYGLSPQIKRYSLLDVGFLELKNGKFQLERPLNPDAGKAAFYLKMTVNKDLKKFKLMTTTASGLQQVDIFKRNDPAMLEQLQYILAELLDRDILIKK